MSFWIKYVAFLSIFTTLNFFLEAISDHYIGVRCDSESHATSNILYKQNSSVSLAKLKCKLQNFTKKQT